MGCNTINNCILCARPRLRKICLNVLETLLEHVMAVQRVLWRSFCRMCTGWMGWRWVLRHVCEPCFWTQADHEVSLQFQLKFHQKVEVSSLKLQANRRPWSFVTVFIYLFGLDYSRDVKYRNRVGLKRGSIVPRGICALDWTYVPGLSTWFWCAAIMGTRGKCFSFTS